MRGRRDAAQFVDERRAHQLEANPGGYGELTVGHSVDRVHREGDCGGLVEGCYRRGGPLRQKLAARHVESVFAMTTLDAVIMEAHAVLDAMREWAGVPAQSGARIDALRDELALVGSDHQYLVRVRRVRLARQDRAIYGVLCALGIAQHVE